MPFHEISIFGVYMAPAALLMLAAWILLLTARGIAEWSGLTDWVWHPALFNAALYLILLSVLVLAFAGLQTI